MARTIDYDAGVIADFVALLYQQARQTVLVFTILGMLVGGFLGLALSGGAQSGGLSTALGLIGAVVVGGIGFKLGQQRAFVLRLQAQTALCQVQIEVNTRAGNRAP